MNNPIDIFSENHEVNRDYKLAVYTAYLDNPGWTFQCKSKNIVVSNWDDIIEPIWNWIAFSYRAHPKHLATAPAIALGHNPDKLTVVQVGEGWRLLSTEEHETLRDCNAKDGELESWDSWPWRDSARGGHGFTTYRTQKEPGYFLRKPVVLAKPTTVRGWLETIEPQWLRGRALANLDPNYMNVEKGNIKQALLWGFAWNDAPEGLDFWHAVWQHFSDEGPLPAELSVVAKNATPFSPKKPRPWTIDEVPLDHWFRRKKQNQSWRIPCVYSKDQIRPLFIGSCWLSLDMLFEEWEHTADPRNGPWLPCGVKDNK